MSEAPKPSEKDYQNFLIDFGEMIGKRKFENLTDLKAYLGKQSQRWQWLNSVRSNLGAGIRQQLEKIFSEIIQPINQTQQHIANQDWGQVANLYSGIENKIKSNFNSRAWLLENDPLNEFIFNLSETKKEQALVVVSSLLVQSPPNQLTQLEISQGLIKLDFYERGINNRLKFEQDKLKKLTGKYETLCTELDKQVNEQNKQFNEKLEEFKKQQYIELKSDTDARSDSIAAWNQELDAARKELKALIETYDQQMSLQKPVNYWKEKRDKHRKIACISFIFILAGMVLAFFGLFQILKSPMEWLPFLSHFEVKNTETQISFAGLKVFYTTGLILIAVTYFWLLRLLVRIFLSNVHLENDASERMTMVTTYLALLRDNSLDKKETVAPLLAAIFRPSGDGIVKDEGLPPGTLELFTRLNK